MFPILFQDSRFVVLDKPAGLKVHPGPGGGPSVEDCFPLLSRRKDGPWLAHRLDADTSGCLVIALRRAALVAAQAEFAAGRARKVYWAVVEGAHLAATGTIDAPLLRQTGKQGWRMVVDQAGQRAVTDWRVLGREGAHGALGREGAHGALGREGARGALGCEGARGALGCEVARVWVEFRPRTGRTHQIRVHAAHLGCPILGDPVYGHPGKDGSGGRLHLLARSIHLDLDPPVTAQAPPPPHMLERLRDCG